MEAIWQSLLELLGVGQEDYTPLQMALRALLMYVAALAMVRWGEKRFLGKNTAFDVILGVILGSVLSRAINGGAALLPTVVAGFVLVGLHWLLAGLAFRSDWFGFTIKGHTRVLVRDGEIQWDEMRSSHISRRDLEGALREQGHTDVERVQRATLERNGSISVIPAQPDPQVLDVTVEDGVQVVRIKLE